MATADAMEAPLSEEIAQHNREATGNDPYVTILVTIDDQKHMVDLTLRQFMQLPELHQGSSVTVDLSSREFARRLQEMGVQLPVVSANMKPMPGEQLTVTTQNSFSDTEIAQREKLAAKFASKNGNRNGGNKRKKKNSKR